MIILHAVLENFWNQYQNKEYYGDYAIEKDGFIHCSAFDTILDVANSNFVNWGQMLLVCIDTDKVEANVKWEDLKNCGIIFPHIYGLLNMSAVIDIFQFNKNSENKFYLPKEVGKYIK